MKILRLAAGLTAAALLGGCASLSKDECLSANWRQIGFSDGAKGLPNKQIEKHGKACAEHGVQVDLDEYLSGRQQGLQTYCQPANGFLVGRSGERQIAPDCPEHLRSGFLEQYNRGLVVHAIEAEFESRRSRAAHYRRKLHQNDDRITEIRAELNRKDLGTDRRTALLNEYNKLVEEKEHLLRHAAEQEREADRLQYRLRQKLREFGY
ncbi:MAG TPA: DUF2799 domain-containing protein [Paucimonas sp.]|nr:DUF2799 domain-containing protein [Paucimonas sp.]